MSNGRALSALFVPVALLAGCASPSPRPEAPRTGSPAPVAAPAPAPPASPLARTQWRLAEIQSMDDAVGTVRPADPARYTMRLFGDGTVAMRLGCNRASGTWKAEASSDGASGRFEFGPLAATRMLCPPPALDEKVTAQAPWVRGYVRKDDRLYLSLMADGGIVAWERIPGEPWDARPDAELEAAVRRAAPSYTRATVDLPGGTGRARYVHGRIDLDGDGREEAFVSLLGSIVCGTGGCNLLVFRRTPEGWTLLNDFVRSRPPFVVSESRTGGWRDLWRLESGGGSPAEWVRHAWDGTRYAERERREAGTDPLGTWILAGELTFDEGAPLDPAP
jgi:heat shock protein HslJ